MIMMALCALVGIAAPVALAWWLVKKHHARLTTVLIGVAVFLVFALVLESIMHQVVLNGPYGPTITGNIWYYALYGGLAAALFEETGRFLAMKFLLKKEPSTAWPGIAYGVGHGGLEVVLIFGMTMISNLVLSVMINTGASDLLLSSVPAEALEQMQEQFSQLETTAAGSYLFGVWERISALIVQISLSVMVWAAVRKGGKWFWFFPLAILLHFLLDGCVVVMSKSLSMAATEAFLFAMAFAIGAVGFLLARKLNRA